ncbi:MAG: 4-phosphoerythronate dehydrogenase [Fibromonadaceae bacterium]|nr:4-phosphoerythronate dehydrogenase [Fibromonadaceae bacterium]
MEPWFAVQYLNSKNISKETLKNSDALIIRSTRKYGAETLLGTKVKFIGTVTSGYEHIDTEFCKQNGIFISTAHGSNAESVADYISAALIEISKKISKPLNELTLGIIGVGAVGTCVKKNAENFGMRLLLSDPPKNLSDNIFAADIITLHTPLETGGKYPTKYLANEEFFGKTKKGTWLINAARGAVCNSEALRHALQSGHLGGAVIDTWENEPNIDTSLLPLLEIATPHIAGHSAEAKINASKMIVGSLLEFFGIESKAHFDTSPHKTGVYSIRTDDLAFRKNPSHFTEIRNSYERIYVN